MFKKIEEVPAQTSRNRDRQPVRRHSHLAGRCEGLFWRRTDRQDVRRIVLAARRYDLAGRMSGQRNGPLGHVALELIDLLANLLDRRTGRLEPSLAWLMVKLRRSRDAVTRALAALRTHGFIDWLRRYEPTGHEGRGPQVRQTSNAYRLALPPRAARLLRGDAPLPDDVVQAQADCEAEIRMLPAEDLVTARIADPLLARLLVQMAKRVPCEDLNTEGETSSGKVAT